MVKYICISAMERLDHKFKGRLEKKKKQRRKAEMTDRRMDKQTNLGFPAVIPMQYNKNA